MPEIEQSFWKPYGCQGLQVYALNSKPTDPFGDVIPELAQITFPVLLDTDHTNLEFQGLGWVSAFPLNVLVDGEGIIRFAYRGHDLTGLKAAIESTLLDAGVEGPLGICGEEN